MLFENRITGWTGLNVAESEQVSAEFLILGVTGRVGDVQFRGDPIRCANDYSFVVDEGTWSGDDFFVASNNESIFVTRRAVNVLRSAQLRNVCFDDPHLVLL